MHKSSTIILRVIHIILHVDGGVGIAVAEQDIDDCNIIHPACMVYTYTA